MDHIEEFREKIENLKNKLNGPDWAEEISGELDKEVFDLTSQLDFLNPLSILGYKKLVPEAVAPKYNYEHDSGFDLHSVKEYTIEPFGRVLIETGLAFDIPENCEMQVRSKSGLALKQGLMVLNSPATIDHSYKSEVKVILFNVNNYPVIIEKGMKVAQAVICPVFYGKTIELREENELKEGERNDRGFGSTGLF
jgi:dUTP pyrophosphatase